MSRRTLIAVALASAACMGTFGMAGSAEAAARPSASIAVIHAHITAGSRPSFRVTASHIPSGTRTYLQRQYGSAHVWKNVVAITHRSETVSAPKIGLGRYSYRIHGTRRGKSIETSKVRNIYSYGTIPFANLCAYVEGDCSPETTQVGDKAFTYVYHLGDDPYPNYETSFSFPKTSCRSVSLTFAYTASESNNQVAYVKVVQSTADPVGSSTPYNTIGSFRAALDGGPFFIDGSVANGGQNILLTGSASCYSTSGAR